MLNTHGDVIRKLLMARVRIGFLQNHYQVMKLLESFHMLKMFLARLKGRKMIALVHGKKVPFFLVALLGI
jgi:hypothetical protein